MTTTSSNVPPNSSTLAPVPDYADALTTINEDVPNANPTTAEKLKAAMLLAGIPVTNNNAWANLIAQSNLEYPSGPVGNNLLGTSLVVNGSHSTNSDGVQSYQTWQDGVYALARMLRQSNMQPQYTALFDNQDASGYADALAKSNWEGSNPLANEQYAQAFVSRYNSLNAKGTIQSAISSAANLAPGTLSAAGAAGQANAESDGLPNLNPFSDVDSFFKALGSGFGLGWTGILGILLGVGLILIGLIFLFHKQAAKVAETASIAAAA